MGEHEESIVSQVLAGHPAGLNRLLMRYGHALAEYVRAVVGDNDHIFAAVYEDVLVDVLKQLRAISGKKSALKRFVFESAARTMRKRYSTLLQSGEGEKIAQPSVDEINRVEAPTEDQLKNAMKGLPAAERELLVLRYRFGFNYGEISDIIKEARVHLEDRLLAARNHFRAKLLGTI